MGKKWYPLLFITVWLLLLAGCREPESSTAVDSQVWSEMPKLQFGEFCYDAIETLPWNTGRCEATSRYTMAETKNGYYWKQDQTLYYADKSDLSLWIPVCSNPSCSHASGQLSCDSALRYNTFFLRDGRIWFVENARSFPELYQGKLDTIALFSRAANGSDLRMEYVLEETEKIPGYIASHSMILTPEHLLYCQINMDQSGQYRGVLYRVAEEGTEILFDDATESTAAIVRLYPFGGDLSFGCSLLEDSSLDMCTITDGNIIMQDTSQYFLSSRYLSDNILRCFEENKGYFDVNVETGETVFLEKNQLQGSGAEILLPNCIIESTLDYYAEDPQGEVTVHAMKIFDGMLWHDVQLPESLAMSGPYSYAVPVSICSDRIFFRVSVNSRSPKIYSIDLSQDTYSLEYCGDFTR